MILPIFFKKGGISIGSDQNLGQVGARGCYINFTKLKFNPTYLNLKFDLA